MTDYMWPLPLVRDNGLERVSDEWGPRVAPVQGASTFHRGIDLGWSNGMTVQSAAEGRVTWAGRNGGEGYSVHVEHPDGGLTKYFHMVEGSLQVSRGQYVGMGQALGTVGDTGVSGGPHLHFETWGNGVNQNPRVFMAEHNAGSSAGRPSTPEVIEKFNRKKLTDMRFIQDTDQTWWLFVDGKVGVATANPDEVVLLDRFINGVGYQSFYRSELALIQALINLVRTKGSTVVG